ncbi:MAG: hypothetical protein ACM3ZU_04365 [Bacteroidota bacterium]
MQTPISATPAVDSFRPDFLGNPITGENLEYDRYYRTEPAGARRADYHDTTR